MQVREKFCRLAPFPSHHCNGARGSLIGLFNGLQEWNRVRISHLLFSDDIFVYCEANNDHFCFLCYLFLCFEGVSGLKVNVAMSELLLIARVENVASLVDVLGGKVSTLPMTYLGLPLRAPFKVKALWDGIIEKMKHCLCNNPS